MKLLSPPYWTDLGHIVDGVNLVWWYDTLGMMDDLFLILLGRNCAGPVHSYYHFYRIYEQ